MALNIVGTTPGTLARGIESAETGINVRRFQVRYFAEVNDKLEGITGEGNWRAISGVPSREITAEGEVSSNTGLMTFAIGAVATFANDIVFPFNATIGGKVLVDEVTETQERAGWRSISMRCTSNPLIT